MEKEQSGFPQKLRYEDVKKTKSLLKWSKYHERPNHVRSIYTYSGASWRINECLQFLMDSNLGANKHPFRCDILNNAYVELSDLQTLAPKQNKMNLK